MENIERLKEEFLVARRALREALSAQVDGAVLRSLKMEFNEAREAFEDARDGLEG